MYTQNTPVHIKLWHKDFWLMAIANMFVTIAVYMQIPVLPEWMDISLGLPSGQIAVVMGLHGIGIFMLGCMCSWLVQHYRRNKVCLLSVAFIMLCIAAIYYACHHKRSLEEMFIVLSVIRFIQGAVFGLAQMVLSSTLIIDTCESFQRTEANHSAAWFSRFALSLGPALGLLLYPCYGFDLVLLSSLILCAVSILFISMVKFPFKAPEDTICKMSLDRFFLPQGKWLFINLALITTVVGIILSSRPSIVFYAMVMCGFFLALLAQRFLFANAELKSEITTGLILILLSLLIMFSGRHEATVYMAPVLLGCGIGIIGARFLLFFIKLSHHCQRGTSQSTYFLAWEFGLSAGLFIGYFFLYGKPFAQIITSFILTAIALVMYIAFTHTWYMRNKNR